MLELAYEVSAAEVDPEYLHVDHTRSLKILEWARYELLKVLGFPNAEFIARGLFPVVTGVRAKYRREVVLGPVMVTCDGWSTYGRGFTMKQRILNSAGKLAVDAEVDWLFMDGATKSAAPAPEPFLAALRAWSAPAQSR